MADYQFKTDRKVQWEKRKLGLENLTRKEIKELENYFNTGEITVPNKWGCLALLFLHPEQSIESWQDTLLNRFNIAMYVGENSDFCHTMDEFYEYLQQSFLGYIVNYDFDPEDRAWIFKQIFGEVYDPERLFPLRLPGEQKFRKISYSADEILRYLLNDVHFYIEGDYEASYVEYVLGYLDSLLPHSSGAGFVLMKPDRKKDKTGCAIFNALVRIIRESSKDSKNSKGDEANRIELAKKVKAVIDTHKDGLGEYNDLVTKVLAGDL